MLYSIDSELPVRPHAVPSVVAQLLRHLSDQLHERALAAESFRKCRTGLRAIQARLRCT